MFSDRIFEHCKRMFETQCNNKEHHKHVKTLGACLFIFLESASNNPLQLHLIDKIGQHKTNLVVCKILPQVIANSTEFPLHFIRS